MYNQSEMFSKLVSSEELSTLSSEISILKNDNNLLHFFIENRVILIVDWSGENEENHIISFLQFRLEKLGKTIKFNSGKIYSLLTKNEELGNIQRGDSVPFILNECQKILKKENLQILLLERGDDAYYISLVIKENLKYFKKLSDDFWSFSSLNKKKTAILYIINCPCGSMNVWELKITEPSPSDAYCNSCEKQLFDKNGNALYTLEKDYI